jgi:hypothetical protein
MARNALPFAVVNEVHQHELAGTEMAGDLGGERSPILEESGGEIGYRLRILADLREQCGDGLVIRNVAVDVYPNAVESGLPSIGG